MNYKKEYKKYLTSSVLDTANNKITSHSFITAFAVYLGLSNFAIGIYAVLDTITNIIQIFAAPLFSKIGQSKLRQIHHFYFFGCPCVVGFCGLPAFWLPLFFNTISSAFTYQSTSAPV